LAAANKYAESFAGGDRILGVEAGDDGFDCAQTDLRGGASIGAAWVSRAILNGRRMRRRVP
jgi:hypothetical protein